MCSEIDIFRLRCCAVIVAIMMAITGSAQKKNRSHLSDETHELQEVVVTGTGTRHLLKDAPVQTEVITRRMLDTFSGKSIEEILGGLTASFAFNEGDMGSQMQLGGLGNGYILVLIDGKRLHGDNGGENDLSLIDPHNIERIEIVKGAQSALYGSDAIAGVVNIITRKHDTESILLENNTRFASGGGMDYDFRQHNGVGFAWGKVQSYTNFQLQTSSGWQNTTNEYAEAQVITNSKNKTSNHHYNWQVTEKLTWKPLDMLEMYAEGSYYNKEILRPHDAQRASIVQNGYDLMYKNASAAVGGKWLLAKKENGQDVVTLDIDWNKHAYYYNYTDKTYGDIYYNGKIEHEYPYYPGDRSLQSDQQRMMANAKGIFHLGMRHTLSAGAEYRYDYLKAPLRVKDETADDWTMAVYAQEEYTPLRWLNITAGLRLNQNAAFGFRATPKVSMMASLGDFRLRIGWSEGFKSPTPKELNYHYLRSMGSSTYYYMGNSKLKAQTSDYFSAGIEYRSDRFTASVTGYFNHLDNMIALVPVKVGDIPADAMVYLGDGSMQIEPKMYRNTDRAKTYGVDVNVNYSITKEWTVGGNYSYLNTDAELYNGARNRYDKVTIDGMAHHKWNAFATWGHRFSPSYRLAAGLYGRGSSKRYYQTDGDGKAFQIWKLSTSHDFSRRNAVISWSMEAGVDNIFNYVDRTMRPYHLGTTACGTNAFISLAIKFNKGKNKINTKIKKQTNHEED